MTVFRIDAAAQTSEFTHYWKNCVGSCHALTGLREDWRKQLKMCRDELGFRYVRFHGLLNQCMSVYKKWREEPAEYSFYNIDSIFDYLLEIGMKPFVELGFMPDDMASGSKTVFHYKANITPPKDYTVWGELVENLVRHLVNRYGLEEVRTWFFEVWNEPNLECFWAGTKEEYFLLYEYAARAVKGIDTRIRVGGPATANNEWITEIIHYCENRNVPLDFVSTHHYPTDAALGHNLNMEEQMAQSERGILRKMVVKALEQAGKYPLYYTEWNNSPSSRDGYHDKSYAAAFVIKTIVDNHRLVDIYSYWSFSDIFEECGLSSKPFHGGFGLLNIYGIPKPVYRAFEILGQLGEEQLPVNVSTGEGGTLEALAVKKGDEITVVLYNHNIPLAPIKDENAVIELTGLNAIKGVKLKRIDSVNANAVNCWRAMGSPEYPTKDELQQMFKASEIAEGNAGFDFDRGMFSLEVTVPPHGIAAVIIQT